MCRRRVPVEAVLEELQDELGEENDEEDPVKRHPGRIVDDRLEYSTGEGAGERNMKQACGGEWIRLP